MLAWLGTSFTFLMTALGAATVFFFARAVCERAQGALLSLPVLSRRRTEELAALMRRGGFWRFQWALDVEVCYSERGAGWLRRADVEKARARGKSRGENSLPWWAG